jgi:hypothetical protein
VPVTIHLLHGGILAAQQFEARGFLGTVGAIAAATIIFFIAIGFVVGLILGIVIGRLTKR